ncbi:butyrophilin subfamily 1 member A1-like [Mauremys reevesii]|uniref:butyrophilin subfamily 1 member A1-like n=1 Tax=Mauremys reevesii TaxID=260615 RepID=UPI00193EC3FE|nr:butyrophilin subfamily 1 member A1-like [Mauremys reevesii]XP_039374843.1 butyrophilin subfamily 1 member A1-like [Mauremys reevesii]
MKGLSICHSSITSSSLPDFIIFFITFYVQKLESATRFTVIGPDQPVTAIVGEATVLPCHLSPRMSAENMEVRWFRSEFTSFVHLYQHGKDQYEQQMPEYHGRTELLKASIMDGNVALRIVNVRPSDEGEYRCFVQDDVLYEEAVLDLKVEASGSAPQISVEGYQDGGIRVVCQSAGWYPEPEVLWQDRSGQLLSSSTKTKSRDGRGLFEIQGSIIITENSNQNLSCSISNAYFSLEKEPSTFYISDFFFPRMSPWPVVCSVTLVILLVFISLTLFLFMLRGKHLNTISKLQVDLEWRRSLSDAANVTLDPNTAHPELVLSEDRKSVRWGDTPQDLPDNPERFDTDFCVLGCEGFTSGRHCWEVEVGDGRFWAVGVARESVGRKGWISRSPEGGIWAVERWWGQFWALSFPATPLPKRRAPSRIRVYLDCDWGQVTFIDARDGAPIFTFLPGSIPGDRIQPWFQVWAESRLRLHP